MPYIFIVWVDKVIFKEYYIVSFVRILTSDTEHFLAFIASKHDLLFLVDLAVFGLRLLG